MNPLTLEWIEKAEGDIITAQREYRARKFPNYDAACFHAQQTAEKYLKAWLQEAGKDIPRIHIWSNWFHYVWKSMGLSLFWSRNSEGWMVMRYEPGTPDRMPIKMRH